MNKNEINKAMLFKLRREGIVILLYRHDSDKDVFYDKHYMLDDGAAGLISLESFDGDLLYNNKNWYGGASYDIVATKQYHSQCQAIAQLLSECEPEWDWVREENTKENDVANLISKLEQQLQEAKSELETIKSK